MNWTDFIASLFIVADNVYFLSISIAHLLSFHESKIFSVFVCPLPCSLTCVTWRSVRFQTERQTRDRRTDSLQFFSFQISSPLCFCLWYSRNPAQKLLPVFHPQGTQISSLPTANVVSSCEVACCIHLLIFVSKPHPLTHKASVSFQGKNNVFLMFLISVADIYKTLIQGASFMLDWNLGLDASCPKSLSCFSSVPQSWIQ